MSAHVQMAWHGMACGSRALRRHRAYLSTREAWQDRAITALSPAGTKMHLESRLSAGAIG